MRRIFTLVIAAAISGCGGSDEQASPSLDGYAGQWAIAYMAPGSDSVIVTATLNATNTTEGWTTLIPDRDPIPVHVVPGGDSVLAHAGPFESVLRPGVMVSTESAVRLVGDVLEGWMVARYATSEPDSVVRLVARGTRVPQ